MLSIYREDPNVTDEQKLRLIVGITVPAYTEIFGEVEMMTLASGRYAQAKLGLSPGQLDAAWSAVCGCWFPDSGYVAADGLAFERYLSNPEEHPEGRHIPEICVPVQPF